MDEINELKHLIKETRKYFPPNNLNDIEFLSVILKSIILKGEKAHGTELN